MTAERQKMRELRLRDIRSYVSDAIDRSLKSDELVSLKRLNDQDLHLLAATLDNLYQEDR